MGRMQPNISLFLKCEIRLPPFNLYLSLYKVPLSIQSSSHSNKLPITTNSSNQEPPLRHPEISRKSSSETNQISARTSERFSENIRVKFEQTMCEKFSSLFYEAVSEVVVEWVVWRGSEAW
ncbi:hypothetical protein WUBG_01509 [Wuchereria bancrofti]|uniref:Uncharacterized protein n=1 Tax=Wuchereria bancrofti TaxID=6293 RepID=J9BJL3_WUCBA|nr:hypothetical protein WUBG_01509 [Wuchereria bancrofti]